ncbi:MAG TPA: hypothetical protein VF824_05615 [Thermoanaerobaculia bacterium]|jgi:hypothetical protein
MRIAAAAFVPFVALSAFAQHDITQVAPAPAGGAIATPLPESQRRALKRYDLPDLAGAKQALGSQLVDGHLPRPLVDYSTREGGIEQRVSIFEGGLVVVNMTGAATIRKKMILPSDALKTYLQAVSPEKLRAIEPWALTTPLPERRSVLRVYDDRGAYVERVFHPGAVPPKSLNDQLAPLRDLLRAVSEDRDVTSSVAGYEPKEGDKLVADDQKIYKVVRIIPANGVVELECLSAPTRIYVAKKDLHLYFVGAAAQE